MNVFISCHTKLQPQKYCTVILVDAASCQNMVLLQNGKIKYLYNIGCAELLLLRGKVAKQTINHGVYLLPQTGLPVGLAVTLLTAELEVLYPVAVVGHCNMTGQ